jgi:hypothetical protein
VAGTQQHMASRATPRHARGTGIGPSRCAGRWRLRLG